MSYRADDLENLCAFNKKVFNHDTLGCWRTACYCVYNVLHYKIWPREQVWPGNKSGAGLEKAIKKPINVSSVWDYLSHVITHYIGLEILRTDNSSLPARRLIISLNKSMSFGLVSK